MPTSWPDSVTILLIDDEATGTRLARDQTTTTVSSGVICRHFERSAREVIASGREEVSHTDQFHFPTDPAVTTAHRLSWTPDGSSTALLYRVIAEKRRNRRRMPWIVYTERIETGPA